MATTTFNGPVVSENGFESSEKNADTGVYTKKVDANKMALANTGGTDTGGAVLLNAASTHGFVFRTYQATVTVANGATTGTESAIGIPSDFIPMFCIVQNNTVTTSGGNITDVGTQGVASAYVAGCVVASSSAQSVMFACNGANGIGSAGSGATAGIPLTSDEVMVTMVDPGLTGASVTVTLLGVSNTTTLDLA